MINTSSAYRTAVKQNSRVFAARGSITLSSGETVTLANGDFMQGGIRITGSTSASDEFDIGTAAVGKIVVSLKNYDGKWNNYDFAGASLSVGVGLKLPDGTTEWQQRSGYTVFDPVVRGGVVAEITAKDNLQKFDRKYDSALSYPATLLQILQDACTHCSVSLYTTSFTNSAYTVAVRPSDDAVTYRDVVSYIAQLAGCWARCDSFGRLILGWYDMDRLYQDTANILDGGDFADYAQADTEDGGTFSSYSEKYELTGGVFRQNLLPPAEISSLKSCAVSAENVCITGVQIIPIDGNKTTWFKGSNGYVASIEKNPLAQDNLEQLTADLAESLIGFRFRPMSVSALDDPAVEAGDAAWLTDPKGNRYPTIISNFTWNINGYETFSADAETQAQRQQTHYSAAAKAVQTAKQETTRQITAYDTAVGNFSSMAALAMGLYFTRQEFDDGSTILYWHDKSDLSDSQTIWKLSQSVFAVSDDGGTTWRGMDSTGNILAKVLTVLGINASWINCGGSGTNGQLKVLDSSDNEMLILDNRGVTMQNGAKLMGGNGVLSTFLFESQGTFYGGFGELGWNAGGGTPTRDFIYQSVAIPSNITVISATAYVDIMSNHLINNTGAGPATGWYTASNIKLFAATDNTQLYVNAYYAGEYTVAAGDGAQVGSAWSPGASASIQERTSDVTQYVVSGKKTLFYLTGGADTYATDKECTDTAWAKVTVVIVGYVKN